jgi:hypothetical protein|tara:strand:- start:40 stop:228 length:189 start_codon:yes stop_codon:yes gene_type:complete
VNQLIKFNNKLLIVKRKFKESELKPNFDTNVMKQWTMSDTLLRKNGVLYCCETIEDAEIIKQ